MKDSWLKGSWLKGSWLKKVMVKAFMVGKFGVEQSIVGKGWKQWGRKLGLKIGG